jgi:hypothetical protein
MTDIQNNIANIAVVFAAALCFLAPRSIFDAINNKPKPKPKPILTFQIPSKDIIAEFDKAELIKEENRTRKGVIDSNITYPKYKDCMAIKKDNFQHRCFYEKFEKKDLISLQKVK